MMGAAFEDRGGILQPRATAAVWFYEEVKFLLFYDLVIFAIVSRFISNILLERQINLRFTVVVVWLFIVK